MLQNIYIKNFVIIDEINIKFYKGFSVITGETGAGKSIILDALSLLFGKRADSSIIQKDKTQCVIEASFDISNLKLENLFKTNELVYENIVVLRREFNINGKSRAFINDELVTLNILKNIAEFMFYLHSQNENSNITDSNFRLNIIDIIANSQKKYSDYKNLFFQLEECKNTIKFLSTKLEKLNKESEFNKFQAEQLKNAKLNSDNEIEDLEENIKILENAEEIKNNLQQSALIIDNDEFAILKSIKELKILLSKIAKNYKSANNFLERIENINNEFKDINNWILNDYEKIEDNPELLQTSNSRIDFLNSLLLKHQVKNIIELKKKFVEYESLVQNSEDLDIKIKELQEKEEKLLSETKKIAEELSKLREKSFQTIEKQIIATIKELGIEYGIFKIENIKSSDLTNSGYDNINFLFSANKSVEAQLLEKVASGGEFSRLMLAINALLSDFTEMPTIIFDEIDTGVSGEIASKMGKMMKKIAEKTQVISITHLPQVAAIGDTHYKVFKITDSEKTISEISEIKNEDRIKEIAGMISGERLTNQAIENAKTLLFQY